MKNNTITIILVCAILWCSLMSMQLIKLRETQKLMVEYILDLYLEVGDIYMNFTDIFSILEPEVYWNINDYYVLK